MSTAAKRRASTAAVKSAIEKNPAVNYFDLVEAVEKESMEIVRYYIQLFTSLMIDASLKSFEENIAIAKEVVELAHPVNGSVETELGTIEIIYTQPQMVKELLETTGVDTFATAIGTSHGIYPKDMKPKLKIDLLKEMRAPGDIPLVLNGGSANPAEEIARR